MLIAILVLLIVSDLSLMAIMFMLAAIVGNKSKTYEESQAEFFKAWGDKLISENKK